MSSYRTYVPWARTYLNDKYNKNKPTTPPTNEKQNEPEKDKKENEKKDKDKKEKDSSSLGRSRYSGGTATTSRIPDSSISSLNSYRPGNYRPTPTLPPSSYIAPRARERERSSSRDRLTGARPREHERSSSRERYTSSYIPREKKQIATENSSLYPRPTYTRSNSTLSESDTEKNFVTTSGYRKYGTSPSRTISYVKPEEKNTSISPVSPISLKPEQTTTRQSANPYTNRFLSAISDQRDEGRYTYRTRPQPVLKKLEISIPKTDIGSPVSPISPTTRSPISPLSPKPPSPNKFLTTATSPVRREEEDDSDFPKNIPCTISVVNRGTSPNPPSTYARTRRSEIAREIQRDVARPRKRPECKEQETQTDKVEESSRYSRFGTRTTAWSSYLDRFGSSSYTPISRFSSARYSSDPPRITRNTRNETEATTKSTVSAADKLKEGISNLVASLQSPQVPISSTTPPAKRESPPKTGKSSNLQNAIEKPRNLNSQEKPKIENKSKSPEKVKAEVKDAKVDKVKAVTKAGKIETFFDRFKGSVRQKTPENVSKRSSPENHSTNLIKTNSRDKILIRSSPEKKAKSKSPDKFCKSRSPEKTNKSSSCDKVTRSSVSPEKQSTAGQLSKSNSPQKEIKSGRTTAVLRHENTADLKKISEPVEPTRMPSKLNSDQKHVSEVEILEQLVSSIENSSTITTSEEIEIPKKPSETEICVNSSSPPAIDNPNNSVLQENQNKDTIIQDAAISNLSTEKSSRESSVVPDSLRNSPQRDMSGRTTPRRNVLRDEPIVLQEKNMSTDLIVGPMVVDTAVPKLITLINETQEKSQTCTKKPPLSPNTTMKTDKLPPPSPKLSIVKTSSSLNAMPKIRVQNKDFRKSPLNMAKNEDVKEEPRINKRAVSEGNSPLCPHKPLKSISANSINDHITNCNIDKVQTQKANEPTISLSNSSSQVKSDSSSISIPNMLENAESSSDVSFKSSSGIGVVNKTDSPKKSEIILRQQPPSRTQFIRHSRSSRNDSSSTSSSSESCSEDDSDEESVDEFKPQVLNDSHLLRENDEKHQRLHDNNSSNSTSEDISSLPVDKASKSSTDKPPLPPNARVKEEASNKATSFLMRALAPVTNLLWVNKKQDISEKSENNDNLRRSNTSQSISEIADSSESFDIFIKTDDGAEKIVDDNANIRDNNEAKDYKGNCLKKVLDVTEPPIKHDTCETVHYLNDENSKEIILPSDATVNVDEISVNTSRATVDQNDNTSTKSGRKSRPVSCEIGWWLKDDEEPSETQAKPVDIATAVCKANLGQSSKSTEQLTPPKLFRSASGEQTWCLNGEGDVYELTSSSSSEEESDSDIEETSPNILPPPRINFKRVESGERAWWMQSTDNVPEGILRMQSNSSLNKEQGSEELKHCIQHKSSDEKAGWLRSNDDIPEGIKRESSSASVSKSQEITNQGRRFKLRHIESGEKALWMESTGNVPEFTTGETITTSDNTAADDQSSTKYRIRHQQSGEKAWWMQSTENIPEGIKRNESSKSISKSSQSSASPGGKLKRMKSSDKGWWLQSQDNLALSEGLKRTDSLRSAKPPTGLQRSDSTRSTGSRPRRIRHIESGERAWWMDSTDNVPEGILRLDSDNSLPVSPSPVEPTHSTTTPPPAVEEIKPFWHKLRPQDSGERPWWLDSNANIPEGITQLTPSSTESESSESESEDEEDVSYKDAPDGTSVPKFPLDIGYRTSPDGLEVCRQNLEDGRESPYDNISWLGSGEEAAPRKKMHLFIGSHTNIDEILGGAGDAPADRSPVEADVKELTEHFSSEKWDQKHEKSSTSDEEEEEEEEEEESEEEESEKEKIVEPTPRRRRRNETSEEQEEPATAPTEVTDTAEAAVEPSTSKKLDDAALQLYKDGDYGSYLDLEASLSEQHEEFEDFHLNRKNSIVLRTQLSVRVHTIIEKLLKSEGRELRRALFSLKQIFQEDKDLVHEFVQNDGLACLIKVGSEADQNYQNYILRALGQVMLYVDGMNGVMAHNETVQWLYTLISSRFRLVVKTALKLLLVFVEYKESNCMLLIKAIKAEDTAKNQVPWCNVMRLLSDYDTSDTELLVYASSLINKTLNGVPDQDTYYDQVDALEEQGMEGIIQRYMSRQGTDLDLLRQFQIYEAVLHHEDGEEKGTPLKQLDEAIRKTLRNRKSSATDSSNERRKSRRHNSTLSPKHGLSNGSGPHLICTPIKLEDQEDEGSSSSRSSPSPSLAGDMRHLNGGSYADNNKANLGVTPALRRRRERAERQRSFIREQQETAAILRKSSSGDVAEDAIQDKNNQKNIDAENRQPSQPTSRTPSRQDILMNAVNSEFDAKDGGNEERNKVLQLNRENTVKDLTQKLANSMLSPTNEQVNRIGDMTGIISKAMEGLAKSKSKGDLKPTETKIVPEIKKSETDIQWENLLENMQRPLTLCDLDFTDLHSDDEMDILAPNFVPNGIPPPPPPLNSIPPPPFGSPYAPPPPPSRLSAPPAPPGAFGVNLKHHSNYSSSSEPNPQSDRTIKKSKKTLKLFWKEVREDPAIVSKLQKLGQNLIWDELSPVSVDTQKLEHLFESRAKDINPKETKQEMNKTKEIIVLDPKRSNAINIGMTKLPPPRAIKTAILKMDSTVMNREGIEKLFAMLPTEEERSRIQEAQVANPDIPLGSAEQFLLTMASITELPARLKLWAFKLDYENIEKEIAEPVMDLKQGMEILRSNRTFRCILGTLLSIGIFLNGNEVKGFQIEYLAKVPEVKDTVHKHSLLHHLCHMVMEKFPESTDLYSEIGAVTRASKVDFDELANNINRLENECKASWDHLKVIAKHDGSSVTKNKMSEFLTDCAQRIIVLSIVHRRIMNRYHKFLLWLGTPPHRIQDTKPNEFCRTVSEFALEYRTTRERVLQQLEKKANHRERNKTRGKMITEVGKFRSKETDRADAELRQLLGGDMSETETIHGTWRRQRKDLGRLNSLLRDEVSEHLTDGDDEILESLVKTATKTPVARTTPRERKRTRHADLKRSRTRENCPAEASYSNT